MYYEIVLSLIDVELSTFYGLNDSKLTLFVSQNSVSKILICQSGENGGTENHVKRFPKFLLPTWTLTLLSCFVFCIIWSLFFHPLIIFQQPRLGGNKVNVVITRLGKYVDRKMAFELMENQGYYLNDSDRLMIQHNRQYDTYFIIFIVLQFLICLVKNITSPFVYLAPFFVVHLFYVVQVDKAFMLFIVVTLFVFPE